MIDLLLICAGIAIAAALGNLYAARRLSNRPTRKHLRLLSPVVECDDGTSTRLESIPSLAGHETRMHDPRCAEPYGGQCDQDCDSRDERVERDDAWMQTFSGRKFYPLAPKASDVELADVAHGLAMVCRYGGHARQFYSVAEHCVLVSEFVEMHAHNAGKPPAEVRRLAQLALMHDSAEAYIGDMIRPLKHQPEMSEFRRAEAAIELAIAEAFKLQWTPEAHTIIKTIDDRILVDEISHLMPNPEMYIRPWLHDMSPLGARFRCLPPAEAFGVFMARYHEVFA